MSYKGSITLCEEFIKNNLVDYVQSKLGVSQNDAESYSGCIRYLFEYLKRTIPESILYAMHDLVELPDGDHPEDAPIYAQWDRSDYLVFVTIIAVLSGDTRFELKNWMKSLSTEYAEKKVLELLASNVGVDIAIIKNRLNNDTAYDALRELLRISSYVIRNLADAEALKLLVESTIKLIGSGDRKAEILEYKSGDDTVNGYVTIKTSGLDLQDSRYDDIRSYILTYRPMGFSWIFDEGVIDLDFGSDEVGGYYGWFRYNYDPDGVFPYQPLVDKGLVLADMVNDTRYRYRYGSEWIQGRETEIGYSMPAGTNNLPESLTGLVTSLEDTSGEGIDTIIDRSFDGMVVVDLDLMAIGMHMRPDGIYFDCNAAGSYCSLDVGGF